MFSSNRINKRCAQLKCKRDVLFTHRHSFSLIVENKYNTYQCIDIGNREHTNTYVNSNVNLKQNSEYRVFRVEVCAYLP